jgi:hypothetical protein
VQGVVLIVTSLVSHLLFIVCPIIAASILWSGQCLIEQHAIFDPIHKYLISVFVIWGAVSQIYIIAACVGGLLCCL